MGTVVLVSFLVAAATAVVLFPLLTSFAGRAPAAVSAGELSAAGQALAGLLGSGSSLLLGA